MPAYLDALNDAQRAAVEQIEGPLLILAGAGSGKTRALTTRLAHIVSTGHAYPWQILCVTFTNKAAKEMSARAESLLGSDSAQRRPEWIGTFHSLAARMLRRHANHVGLETNFTILDTDDQLRVARQLLRDRGADHSKATARSILAIINRLKDRGLTPDRVTPAELSPLKYAPDLPDPLSLYCDYQARLLALNACDFGDLLLHCLTLFREHSHMMAMWPEQFRYILVDEYQDTNISQYLWLRLLAQKHGNICCVGDDDQSIYAWRGAEVDNILKFEMDFPGARVIRMERNYRSTPNILDAANALISHNTHRLGKTLWTQGDSGEPICVAGCLDSDHEAEQICRWIFAEQRRGTSESEIAVLVRATWLMRGIEDKFIQHGLPYGIVGGQRFYERQEIRDAIAYFRLCMHAQDDLAFERIVNMPKRGAGPASLQKIRDMARLQNTGLFEGLKVLLEGKIFKGKQASALQKFVDLIEGWRAVLPGHHEFEHTFEEEREHDLGSWARRVLRESGILDHWKALPDLERGGRLDNLQELCNAMSEFESLAAFLEHISLVMETERGEGEARVTLMTIHAAKGLEFDSVCLAGWEYGIFPSLRSLEDAGDRALEEERRLAYVGITRARQRVQISYAMRRNMHGTWSDSIPSPFVSELPETAIQLVGDAQFRSPMRRSFQNNRMPISRPPPRTPPQMQAQQSHSPRPFQIGDRVQHSRLGSGHVVSFDGDAAYVELDSGGIKSIFMSYLKPL